MGFADKKVELLKIVADADEELTGKLIEFAKQHSAEGSQFTKEDLDKFHKTAEEFISSGEKGYTVEEAHSIIRNKHKK